MNKLSMISLMLMLSSCSQILPESWATTKPVETAVVKSVDAPVAPKALQIHMDQDAFDKTKNVSVEIKVSDAAK